MALIFSSLCNFTYIAWEGLTLEAWPWNVYQLYLFSRMDSYVASLHWVLVYLTGFVLYLGLLVTDLTHGRFGKLAKARKVFGNAHFATKMECQRAGLFSNEDIVLGKAHGKTLHLPGYESVLVVAPTGSGKTAAIAIPNLIEWQGSVVVNDLKGELYKTTGNYRKNTLKQAVYQFAPANSEMKTHRYNPFFYVSSDKNLRLRDLQLIAEALIPASLHGEPIWHLSSREIFVMLAIYLFESKNMATLAEIYDLSRQEDFIDWVEFEVTERKIQDPIFYAFAFSLLSADKDRLRPNLIKDFHSRLSLLADPLIRHATSGNDFDLRGMRKNKMSIYLSIPDVDKERLASILSLLWIQFIAVMTEAESDIEREPYGVLAILDEFGNLAEMKKLKDGLSFLRSYRVRFLLFVQYLSQISATYGEKQSKGFLNSKVKIAFTLNDWDDANFFARNMGQQAVQYESTSTNSGNDKGSSSRNFSQQFRGRALMTPDEIMQMSQDDMLILMEAHAPIRETKHYWFKDKKYLRLSDIIH